MKKIEVYSSKGPFGYHCLSEDHNFVGQRVFDLAQTMNDLFEDPYSNEEFNQAMEKLIEVRALFLKAVDKIPYVEPGKPFGGLYD